MVLARSLACFIQMSKPKQCKYANKNNNLINIRKRSKNHSQLTKPQDVHRTRVRVGPALGHVGQLRRRGERPARLLLPPTPRQGPEAPGLSQPGQGSPGQPVPSRRTVRALDDGDLRERAQATVVEYGFCPRGQPYDGLETAKDGAHAGLRIFRRQARPLRVWGSTTSRIGQARRSRSRRI